MLPMNADTRVLYWTLLGLLVAVVAVNLAVNQALLLRLRRDHRSLWERLGEPRLFSRRSWSAAMMRPRIVWAREVWELPGGGIRRVVCLGRVSDIIALLILAALAVVFIAMFDRS